MPLGLKTGTHRYTQTLSAILQTALNGLSATLANPGSHASISADLTGIAATAWTSQAWGTSYGDTTYGTGASPTDYTAGDGGTLFYEGVGDDGKTYRTSAPIQYALGSASAIADGQSWTVDDTSVNIDAAASGANLTFSYGVTGSTAGVTINSSSGLISGTPTAVDSGTITITATDQYSRTYQDTFTFTSAYRAQATAADGLGPYTWTVDDDTLNISAVSDFTVNGNTLTYVITGLPTGVVDDGDGTWSGTPTTVTSGGITITATDEYSRVTTSTPSFTTAYRTQATAANGLDLSFAEDGAISATDITADFTVNGNTLTYTAVDTLPTGLSLSSGGSLTGTPTDITADANYTVRATDEYSRTTDSEVAIEIVSADAVAPVINSFVYNDADDDFDIDLSEAATVRWASSTQGVSPTLSAYNASWVGTTHETGSTGAISGTSSFTGPAAPTTPYGAQRLTIYAYDGANNLSTVSTVDYTHDAVPDAFEAADWSVAAGSDHNELDVTIASLPSANGNTITDVEYRIGGAGGYTSLGATSGTITISMAAASTSYSLDLRAVNGEGNGPAGNSESATSGANQVPSAFVDANWSVATGSAEDELDITIASLPDAHGAAITDVEYDIDAGNSWTSLAATSGTITVTMAAASTSYAIRLRAVNSVGNGAAGNSESATSGAAASSLAIGDTAATNPSGNGSSITVTMPTHTTSDFIYVILVGEEGWMTGSAPTNWTAHGQIEANATSGRSEGKLFSYDAATHGSAGGSVAFSSVLTNSKERAAIAFTVEGQTTGLGATTLNVDNSTGGATSGTTPTVSGTSGRLLVHVWLPNSNTAGITAPGGVTVIENIVGNTASVLAAYETLASTATTTGRVATTAASQDWALAVFEIY